MELNTARQFIFHFLPTRTEKRFLCSPSPPQTAILSFISLFIASVIHEEPWPLSCVHTAAAVPHSLCSVHTFTLSDWSLSLCLSVSKSGAVWWSALVRGWDQCSWPAPRAAGKLLVCGGVFKPGFAWVSVAESKFACFEQVTSFREDLISVFMRWFCKRHQLTPVCSKYSDSYRIIWGFALKAYMWQVLLQSEILTAVSQIRG